MRFSYIFHSLSFGLVLMLHAPSALATDDQDTTVKDGGAGRFWQQIWQPPKGTQVRPYLNEAKLPHNSQWAEDGWTPQDWVEMRGGSPLNVIDGFYRADIITGQKFDKDVPVLEVGQGFLRLSAQEQRRVLAFIDDTYGVTSNSVAGVIEICLDHENETIGLFDKNGLQLQ